MEKKKLIKKIGSGNTMKVRFILFDTEPDRSITGGAFYEGDRFDKDLVEVGENQFSFFISKTVIGSPNLISEWLSRAKMCC